jgi:hypothetical protein
MAMIRVFNGSGKRSLGEPIASISYLSVFIPHFLGRPAENRKILRKLYLDFDLSTYQISELTGWSRNAISDFLRRENITKDVIKSANLKFGERIVGGFRIPQQSELKVIQKILTLRSNGASFQKIARTLNERGFTAKRGGQWSKTTVHQIYKRVQDMQR